MIYHASHVTAGIRIAKHEIDTISFLGIVLALLTLFYWEHRAATRFLKAELDVMLGYVQAVFCWALMLTGLRFEWLRSNVDSSSATNTTALILAVGGEFIFIMNAAIVYRRQESAAIDISRLAQSPVECRAITFTPASRPLQAPLSTWMRPTAPVHQFGVTAIFLAAGGLITLLSSSKLIVPWSREAHVLPMAVVWWAAGLPCALFALEYWLHSGKRILAYDRGLTNAHVMITFLWLLDFARVTVIWQSTLPAAHAPVDIKAHALELFSILAGAAVLCWINLLRGPEPRTPNRVVKRTAG